MTRTRWAVVVGAWLGAALTAIGFGDFGEVHRMMTLQDPRLWATFGLAVALSTLAFAFFGPEAVLRNRPSTAWVLGAICFGAGWALSGACPAGVLVQLSAGYAPALAGLVAMAVGILLGEWIERRRRWSRNSCEG